jgi:hypothetical protein
VGAAPLAVTALSCATQHPPQAPAHDRRFQRSHTYGASALTQPSSLSAGCRSALALEGNQTARQAQGARRQREFSHGSIALLSLVGWTF